jgi:hypothetical protein
MDEGLMSAALGAVNKGGEQPEKQVSEADKSLVKQWLDNIENAKGHHRKAFKKMRDDIKFAKGQQWPEQSDGDERYVVNLVQRHIQQRVAALYAKNPKVVAKRKKRMEFSYWDETPEALQTAMMGAQMGDPQSMQVMQDVMEGRQRRMMIDKVGKTLEILFAHYMSEPVPNFKLQTKQLVRRVNTCGVGYIKLGYQRMMGRSPEVNARIQDFSDRLATLKRMTEEQAEGEFQDTSAEAAELTAMLDAVTNQQEIVLREGLVFDFPKSWSIIVDPACVQLKGFVGAGWVAQEFMFTEDEIEEIYEIDVSDSGARPYYQRASASSKDNDSWTDQQPKGGSEPAHYRVYEIYDKRHGLMLTVCEGCEEFLSQPKAPDVFIEQFFPFFALTFNDIEDECGIYPDSDVRLLRPMQLEYNRARNTLREHRIANRPAYTAPKGVLPESDKGKLADHETSELIELSVPPGTDMRSVIQPLAKVPIDPAVYDTMPFFDDIQKSVGSQEANFGGTSGAAATEVSVAEGSRMATIQSNIDDMDDFLSQLARTGGQIMLDQMTKETVMRIVGPGAVWPDVSRADLVEEMYLDVEAGSSGRPNKAYELANYERIAPTLLQIPGIRPSWLAKQGLVRLDDNLDLTDAFLEGLPSIMSMNRMQQLGTGDPATDPNQQGQEGGDKNTDPQQRQAGPQPAYPTAGG